MPRGEPRLRAENQRLNAVGLHAREQRIKLGDTQDAVCARIAAFTDAKWNPDRRDLYRIEKGTRIVADVEVIALAHALDCSVLYLLFGKTPPPTERVSDKS